MQRVSCHESVQSTIKVFSMTYLMQGLRPKRSTKSHDRRKQNSERLLREMALKIIRVCSCDLVDRAL
jgi:hypothetical protein